MSDFFWFSDTQWERIAPLLPTDVRGRQRVDDRRVLSGIVHALRCGGRWADCTDVYGPKKTCSSTAVASRSTAARAEEKGALAHGIGRTKGGRNTKLHAVCDAKGRPVVLLLTPGNVHDCKVAQRCTEAMPASAELVADKGYDSQAPREWLEERGTQAVIPPRKNRKIQYDGRKRGGLKVPRSVVRVAD